jgi:peptidoglycan/xylan/chitin deacetylase (PgdA/CDA1 family)
MIDVLILCYHAVSPTWRTSLAVTPTGFERQLHYLLRRGWEPTTFTEAVLRPSAPRTLAITFDDAFQSVATYAAPALAEVGARATVFVPTAFPADPSRLSWPGIDHWADSAQSSELDAMSWSALGALAESGWEIGSHTRTHPHLTQLDTRQLDEELTGSREDCARAVGCRCESIAYPYGDVDERVAEAARRAGYSAGAALSRRLLRIGPYREPRVGIYNRDAAWRFRLKAARSVRALRSIPLQR